MLNVVDEFTHECLAIRVDRKLKAIDVIDVLSDLFILRGVPGHIRSDNGPEFIAKSVQAWITGVGAKTAYISPGSPWENGYVESFKRSPSGRTPEWRDLLHAQGGTDRDRELETTLQRCPPPRVARIPSASPGGVRASLYRLAGCARPTGCADQATHGGATHRTLTSLLDHLVGPIIKFMRCRKYLQ